MDSDDIEIDKPIFNTIGASSGLIEYYKKYLGGNYSLDFMRLQYEEYEQEENFVVFNNEDYKYFIIDTTYNEPVYNDWVLDYNFDDAAIRLKISVQGKTQYIVWSGYHSMIIPECMYDFIGEFEYDVAYVIQNNKYNYINLEGELLCDEWFDDNDNFDSELDVVTLNGKKNVFSKYRCELLLDEWVDEVKTTFYDVAAEVYINKKINLMKDNGHLIFPEFVDEIIHDEVYNGQDYFYTFKLNGKYNFMGARTQEVLSRIWFDDVTNVEHDRHNTLAWVVLDGKEYTLDMETYELRDDETGKVSDISTDEQKKRWERY
jgi:hypothetical protein